MFKCPKCRQSELRMHALTSVDLSFDGPESGTEWECLDADNPKNAVDCESCDWTGTLSACTGVTDA